MSETIRPHEMDVFTLEYVSLIKLLEKRAKSVATKAATDFFGFANYETYRIFTRNFFSTNGDGTFCMTVTLIDSGDYLNVQRTKVHVHFNCMDQQVVFSYPISFNDPDVIVGEVEQKDIGILKVPHFMLTDWLHIANDAIADFGSNPCFSTTPMADQDFLVKPVVYTILVDGNPETEVAAVPTNTFTLTVEPNEPVQWYSDNINVATVDNSGFVTIVGYGEVKIHTGGVYITFTVSDSVYQITTSDILSASTSVDGTQIFVILSDNVPANLIDYTISFYQSRNGDMAEWSYNSISFDSLTNTVTMDVDPISNTDVIEIYGYNTNPLPPNEILNNTGLVLVTNNVP